LSYERLLLAASCQQPERFDTLVNNATTKHFANSGVVVGSDEVWFNKGGRRYYTGSRPAQARAVLPPTFKNVMFG
jgi:hypothetical protein